MASSVYGIARSTLDVAMVSSLEEKKVLDFVALLNDQFYVSEPMIRSAVLRKSSFNIIHLKSSIKVDIFICKQRPYDLIAAENEEKTIC